MKKSHQTCFFQFFSFFIKYIRASEGIIKQIRDVSVVSHNELYDMLAKLLLPNEELRENYEVVSPEVVC